VSLNNRIYFRDHPFRGAHGDSRCYVDSGNSGPSFPSSVTPLSFAQNGRLRTIPAGDGIKLDTVSGGTASIDIEKVAAIGDNRI
jgi:hypothetical protein